MRPKQSPINDRCSFSRSPTFDKAIPSPGNMLERVLLRRTITIPLSPRRVPDGGDV